MLRYNIFNMIHKALRLKLYETAQALLHTYFGDKDGAAEVLNKLNEIIDAFENHGYHEDSILMPVIAKFQPEMIASFEKDHKDDHHFGNELKQLQLIYHAAQSDDERTVAGSAITLAFTDYMIFNLQHMQREEVELNKLLWDNFSDDEIKKISHEIETSIPPEEMAVTARWIMQAINSNEVTEWLIAVKENAPEHIFNLLFELTETCLPEQFREKVQQAVQEHKVASPAFA